jgi:hypothetical protein
LDDQTLSPRGEVADVAYRLEREFYQDLSGVIQKWDRDLTALEEDERRRVVLVVQEIGLLRVIRDARIVVKRYERSQMGWVTRADKGHALQRNEQEVPSTTF